MPHAVAPDTIEIDITADDIRASERGSCYRCAAALAARRALDVPVRDILSISPVQLCWTRIGPPQRKALFYEPDQRLSDWILRHDRKARSRPGRFKLWRIQPPSRSRSTL